jgi:hypothetical protein
MVRCEHCGQPALEGDVACWQCGRPLPAASEGAPAVGLSGPAEAISPSLGAVGLYAGLTAAVILAAVLVMAALGRQPLLLVDGRVRPPPDWRELTPAGRAFIIRLPESWAIEEPGAGYDLGDELRELASAATRPLGREVTDLEILFVAQSPPPPVPAAPAFLVVARSRALNRLNYGAAAALANQNDTPASDVVFVDHLAKSHLQLDVPVAAETAGSLICRQQFILGRDEAMLVSLCAPAIRHGVYLATFARILASFQRLSP